MIYTKQKALEYIESLNEEDLIEVTKKQTKSIRSLSQNKYRHAVICKTISDWSWDNTIAVHYMLKTMFNLETTTDLSTDEFAFMCKAIIDLFKEKYGVIIPTPSQVEDLANLETYLF